MSRPLLISDCDDVLLHFAPHFADYVAEAHGYTFRLGRPGFVGALTDDTGADVEPARAWELLNAFFDAEMHRQHLVDGALEALRAISAEADIVILTNIGDQHSANRVVQLERLDIRHRVICNQGGKGRPVAELVAEMHRQHLVDGALDALRTIGAEADIVILTNIRDEYQANRVEQLERLDIRHRVLCNQGGKGRPVAELIADLQPSVTVFVDDLPVHHESVAKHVPDVWRLHMIAEPLMAAATPPSPFAHARIDRWDEALPWILGKLRNG